MCVFILNLTSAVVLLLLVLVVEVEGGGGDPSTLARGIEPRSLKSKRHQSLLGRKKEIKLVCKVCNGGAGKA